MYAPTSELPADLDTLRKTVAKDPWDFVSWEQILKQVEAADGGLDPSTAPKENVDQCQQAFNDFLAQFPLCFGYWKKFADLTQIMEGINGAQQVSSVCWVYMRVFRCTNAP
jgi:pre-mRNA-processing factor 39